MLETVGPQIAQTPFFVFDDAQSYSRERSKPRSKDRRKQNAFFRSLKGDF